MLLLGILPSDNPALSNFNGYTTGISAPHTAAVILGKMCICPTQLF
jgi:hypothetical protein